VGSPKIEVQVTCHHRTFAEYVLDLLEEMYGTYPESRPSGEAATPATAAARANPNRLEATEGEGGQNEYIPAQPKCIAWRTRLIQAMKNLPPDTELTQENMADPLGLSFDRVRELSSEHRRCCRFDWKRDVRYRGLLQ